MHIVALLKLCCYWNMKFSPVALSQRVEESCLNGWPALREIYCGGWVLRFSEGHTRRANSVHPLFSSVLPMEDQVRYCEKLYKFHHLPTIFKVSTVTETALDAMLDTLGYLPAEDETLMLYMDIDPTKCVSEGRVELIETFPNDEWLRVLGSLQNQTSKTQDTHRKILKSLALPAAFAAVRADTGSLAALAFGAVHHEIVCVNSVATDPAFRRRGFARSAIQAVIDWSYRTTGAIGACVPVVANNYPAVALYRALGFQMEVGRYHYRRQSSSGS